jgi:hypothetical protein
MLSEVVSLETTITKIKRISDGATLVMESEGISDNPRVKIIEKDGSETIVPENLVRHILFSEPLANLFGSAPLNKHTRNVMRETNSPSKFGNLIEVGGFEGERLIPFGSDPLLCGTPMAVLDKDGSALGWRLTLTGVETITIDFAPWDDSKGSRRIASLMMSEDAAQTMAALLDPEAMHALQEKLAAQEIMRQTIFPALDVAKVKRALRKMQLQTLPVDVPLTSALYMSLKVEIDHKNIPVAMRISSPSVPAFADELKSEIEALPQTNPRTPRSPKVQTLAYIAQTDWNNRFREVATQKGWRFVELPYNADTSPYQNISTFWITLLSPEQWEKIAPLAYAPARELQNAGTIL